VFGLEADADTDRDAAAHNVVQVVLDMLSMNELNFNSIQSTNRIRDVP